MRAQTCFPPPVEHYCAHFPYKPSAPSLTGTLPDTSKRFSKQSPSLRSTRFLNAQTTTPTPLQPFSFTQANAPYGALAWLAPRPLPAPPAPLAVQVPSVARGEERFLFCFVLSSSPPFGATPPPTATAVGGLPRRLLVLGPVKGPVKGKV